MKKKIMKCILFALIVGCFTCVVACQKSEKSKKNDSIEKQADSDDDLENDTEDDLIKINEVEVIKYDETAKKFKKVKVFDNESFNLTTIDRLKGEYVDFSKEEYQNEDFKKHGYIFVHSKHDIWVPVTVKNYLTGYECKVKYRNIKTEVDAIDKNEKEIPLITMGEVTD